MAFVYTPPKKKGASGKYKTFQRGEAGSIKGSSGTPQQSSSFSTARIIGNAKSVSVKTLPESSYQEVKDERIRLIQASNEKNRKLDIIPGHSSGSSMQTVSPSNIQQVKVYVDSSKLAGLNKEFEQAGIGTAGKFFEEYKKGNVKISGDNEINVIKPVIAPEIKQDLPTFDFFVPKGETGPDFALFKGLEAGQKKADELYQSTPIPAIIAAGKFVFTGETSGQTSNKLFNIPIGFSFPVEMGTVTELTTGTYSGFQAGFKPSKSSVTVTDTTKSSSPYVFPFKQYDIRGQRIGIIPEDIQFKSLGFAGKEEGLISGLKSSELQTQLFPKQVTDKTSIFAPETYKPMSFTEFAEKNPALAKKLAVESGQTIFNFDDVAPQLTWDEQYKISLAQTQEASKGLQLQTTLLGKKPGITPGEKIFVLNEKDIVIEAEAGSISLFPKGKKGQSGLTSIWPDTTGSLKNIRINFEKFTPESAGGSLKVSGTVAGENRFFIFPISGGQNFGDVYKSFNQNLPTSQGDIFNINTRVNAFSISDIKSSVDIGTGQISGIGTSSSSSSKSRQRSDVSQVQQPDLIQDTITTPELVNINPARNNVNTIRTTKSFDLDKFDKKAIPIFPIIPFNRQKGLFNLEIRKGGLFKSVKSGLSFQDAIKSGYGLISGTSAATFRIRRGAKIVPVKPRKGYYSKKGSIIETPRLRINTGGELGEITFKGIRASKRAGF